MRALRLLLLFALLATTLVLPTRAFAGGTELMQGETSITIPAGGEARVNVKAFCLEFGDAYPAAMGTVGGRAEDGVLQILSAAISSGEVDSNPLVPQLAIWAAQEGQTHEELYPNKTIEPLDAVKALQEKAASTEVVPLRDDQGIPLEQAINEGMVELSAENFQIIDAPKVAEDDTPYHGSATMVIRNVSDKDIQLYVPFGFVIEAANEAEQDLIAYVTDAPQSAPAPATMAETGAGEASALLPWLLAAAGLLVMAGAGVMTARGQRA